MIKKAKVICADSFKCTAFHNRTKSRLVHILLMMVLLLAGGVEVHAETARSKGASAHRHQGTFTINLQRHTVIDPRTRTSLPIDEIEIKWAIWVLMGQPVKSFVANYRLSSSGMITTSSGVATCSKGEVSTHPGLHAFRLKTEATEKLPPAEILSTSVFRAWFISADPERGALSARLNKNHKVFIDFTPDSMVPASVGFGISAPGSPEWDQLFKRSFMFGSTYLTAPEAKEVMRRGLRLDRIELIEPHFNVSTALTRHNQQVRVDCNKERQASANDQPNSQSPSLTDKLNARLTVAQTKTESAPQDKPQPASAHKKRQPPDASLSLTDRLNARLNEANARTNTPVSHKSNVGDIRLAGMNGTHDKGGGLQSFCTQKKFYNRVTRFTTYENDKCGYKDAAGNVVIQPKYVSAREFRFGYAIVEDGYRRYNLIDTTGKSVFNRLYHDMEFGEFGLVAVLKEYRHPNDSKGWSYIDLNGNTLIDTDYKSAHAFINGLARAEHFGASKEGSTVYINREFKRVAGPFHSGENFSQGLALVQTASRSYDGHDEYRFLKNDGSLLPGAYRRASSFHESGFASVAKGRDQWGIIDTQGKVILPLEHHGVAVKYSDTGSVVFEVDLGHVQGVKRVQLFNTQGNPISEP